VKMDTLYIVLAILMSAFILYQESRFRVTDDDQAVVVQFGEVSGEAKTDAGVYFKIPFLQEARSYPKHPLLYKNTREIPLGDKDVVTLTIRVAWTIEDPVTFYGRVPVFDDNAREFLDSKIREAERKTIAAAQRDDTVLAPDGKAGGGWQCNPEILREIQERVRADLLEFGIRLTEAGAAVSR